MEFVYLTKGAWFHLFSLLMHHLHNVLYTHREPQKYIRYFDHRDAGRYVHQTFLLLYFENSKKKRYFF